MTLLKLDIDGELPRDLESRIARLVRLLRWRIEAIRYDRTRRGWHVIIGVRRRLNALTVVAVQAILGSDPARETFNLQRARVLRSLPREWRSQDRWNVLYSQHSRTVRIA